MGHITVVSIPINTLVRLLSSKPFKQLFIKLGGAANYTTRYQMELSDHHGTRPPITSVAITDPNPTCFF